MKKKAPPPRPPPGSSRAALKRGLARTLVADNGNCADCDCALVFSKEEALYRRLSVRQTKPAEMGEPYLLMKFGLLVCGACARVHLSPEMSPVHGAGSQFSGARAASIFGRADAEVQLEFPLCALSLRRELSLMTLSQLNFAASLGNAQQNEVLESQVDAQWAMKIPETLSPIAERVEWIRAKYSLQFCAAGTACETLPSEDVDAEECANLLQLYTPVSEDELSDAESSDDAGGDADGNAVEEEEQEEENLSGADDESHPENSGGETETGDGETTDAVSAGSAAEVSGRLHSTSDLDDLEAALASSFLHLGDGAEEESISIHPDSKRASRLSVGLYLKGTAPQQPVAGESDDDDDDDLVLSMIGNYVPADVPSGSSSGSGSFLSGRSSIPDTPRKASFKMGSSRSFLLEEGINAPLGSNSPLSEAPAAPLVEAPAPPEDSGENEAATAPAASSTETPPSASLRKSPRKSDKRRRDRAGTNNVAQSALRQAFSAEKTRKRSFEGKISIVSKPAQGDSTRELRVLWPHQTPSPDSLAGAGFFFCPTAEKPDRVSCYDCGATLSHWEPQDDPMREHRRLVENRKARAAAKGQPMSKVRFCQFLRQKGIVEMRDVLETLVSLTANLVCCECADQNLEVASGDHGTFLCRACGDAQVKFGITTNLLEIPDWWKKLCKKKTVESSSFLADEPWPREALRRFVFLGNTTHREIWEYRLSAVARARVPELSRPEVIELLQKQANRRPKGAAATEQERLDWLELKYEDRVFALPHAQNSQSVFFTNVLQNHGPDVLDYLINVFSELPGSETERRSSNFDDNLSSSPPGDGSPSFRSPNSSEGAGFVSSPSIDRKRERRPTARLALRKGGWLTKHGEGARSWRKGNRRQWWVLRENFLFCYADETDQTNARKAYSLLNAKVEKITNPPLSGAPGSTDITHDNFRLITPQKTLTLHAEGPCEREEWLSVLEQNISWLDKNRVPAGSDGETRTSLVESGDILRQGFVWIGEAGTKRKRRWCVLQDDSIFLFASAKEEMPIMGISIRSVVIDADQKSEGKLLRMHSHDGKSYDLACGTRALSREWMEVIRQQSRALAAQGVPTAKQAPDEVLFDLDVAGKAKKGSFLGKQKAGTFGSAGTPPHVSLQRAADRKDAVKTDWMYKKGEGAKSGMLWKKRWFVLKDGQLAYFKKAADTVPAGSIELSAAKARAPMSDSKGSKGKVPFEVVTPNRTFLVGAATETVRADWIQAINEHMEQILTKD